MRRHVGLFLLAVLVVLAGCGAPTHDGLGTPPPGQRDDPASDRLGWEGGYWYDDPLPVNASDGLTEAELDAVVTRAMARVEELRGLEFKESVPVEIMSREDYRERVRSGNTSEDARVFQNVKREALFLVGESTDSVRTERENRGSNVLGFYSPGQDRIVVISDSETPSLNERTLVHELVHALQDQYFGFRIGPTTGTAEASMTGRSVIEGDASFVDDLFQARCEAGWDCLRPPPRDGGGGGGGSSLHRGLYLTTIFVYVDGPTFVESRYDAGGWEAVNALYESPPASTEQVIDPSTYGVDEPTNVSLLDRSNRRWERVTPPGRRAPYATLGQPSLVAMFAYPTYDTTRPGESVVGDAFLTGDDDPLNYDIDYASGWDGDKMWVYRNASGANGYAWRLVWDDAAEAREFAAGYRKVLRYWGGSEVREGVWRIPEGESDFADAFSVRVRGETVTIVNAPTIRQLSGVDTSLNRRGQPA